MARSCIYAAVKKFIAAFFRVLRVPTRSKRNTLQRGSRSTWEAPHLQIVYLTKEQNTAHPLKSLTTSNDIKDGVRRLFLLTVQQPGSQTLNLKPQTLNQLMQSIEFCNPI